jgi:putative MATE family efflux protein
MVQRLFSFLTVVLNLSVYFNMQCCCEGFVQPLVSRHRKGYQIVGEAKVPSNFPRIESSSLESMVDDDEKLIQQTENKKSAIDNEMAIAEENRESTGKRILDLSIPALGALLIDPLLTLADTAFVGRYSESANELAGMGSAAALLTFSFYLFNFLCTATTPLVSSKRSSGKESEALAVGGQALSLALGLGSILSMALIVVRQPLLDVMGTSISGPEANGYALDFLSIRAFAAPAVFCISASTGILRGYLDTKTSIVILVLANLVNLALDIGLIAYAGMGPTGAAIATTTAEWISALLFLGVLSGKLPSAAGQLGRKGPEDEGGTLVVTPALSIPPWEEIKPLVVASSSVFLRSFVLQVSLSAAAAVAARGGETVPGGAASSISAHQIAIQLWILCSFISDALAAASQGLVADALGREDEDDVRNVSKTVLVYSTVLGLFLAAMLQVGYSTDFLLTFFTSDVGTQAALAEILALIIIAQPLNSLVFAADGILQGASEFTFQAKSMALSGATGALSFVLLQKFGTGDTLAHIWTALIMLQAMRGLTSAVKILDKEGPIKLFESTAQKI